MIVLPETIQRSISAAIGGDAAAMGTAFEWFRPRLYAHALRMCGNSPVAQDAVQDTFIAAFTHLQSLREPTSFYPWLKRILVNNCYQMLRKEKSEDIDSHLARQESLIHRSIEWHYESIADKQRVFSSMQHLSAELRACIMLRYFTNYSRYDVIAQLLGIPVGTVRSRLSAARQQLTHLLNLRQDAGDTALRESREWSLFYRYHWENVYDDSRIRSGLLEHLHPSLQLRFTSGKSGKGRKIFEREINEDLEVGSRFHVESVISSGNITVVEGPNVNHPTQPDRCAPSSAFVMIREKQKATAMQIFDSARP